MVGALQWFSHEIHSQAAEVMYGRHTTVGSTLRDKLHSFTIIHSSAHLLHLFNLFLSRP